MKHAPGKKALRREAKMLRAHPCSHGRWLCVLSCSGDLFDPHPAARPKPSPLEAWLDAACAGARPGVAPAGGISPCGNWARRQQRCRPLRFVRRGPLPGSAGALGCGGSSHSVSRACAGAAESPRNHSLLASHALQSSASGLPLAHRFFFQIQSELARPPQHEAGQALSHSSRLITKRNDAAPRIDFHAFSATAHFESISLAQPSGHLEISV